MARRKKKENEVDWTPPEFDEVDYMRREISGAIAAVITIGWAVVGALVAYGLLVLGLHPAIAFFLGILVAFGLIIVMPLLGVDAKKFQRRDWAGHGVTYFFSWLAIWILLLNVPVSDFTSPIIFDLKAGSYNDSSASLPQPGETCTAIQGSSVRIIPPPGDTALFLLFRATDNLAVTQLGVAVNGVPATTSLRDVSGLADACATSGGLYPQGTHLLTIPLVGTAFGVTISAQDARGHRADASVTLSV